MSEGLVEKVAIRIAVANSGGTWATHYTDKQKALWRMRAAEIISEVTELLLSNEAKAHQAIGAYFSAFSGLDRELGETVKVIFRLQHHEAADAIVAALEDFSRKARLVRAAVAFAKNADGSETSESWKTAAEDLIKRILSVNDADRVLLAHSFLEPTEDGSVRFTRLHLPQGVLKSRQETWTKPQFDEKIDELFDLTRRLREVKNDLSTFKVTVPNLGWMVVEPQLHHPRPMPDALRAVIEPASSWAPKPPDQL